MRNKRLLVMITAILMTVILVACTTTTTQPTTTSTTASSGTTQTTASTTTTTTTTTVTTTTTTTVPTTTTTTVPPLPTTLNVLDGLTPGNEGVYSLVATEELATISYNKHGFAWPSLDIELEESVARFNKLNITASGEGTLLVRLYGGDDVYEVRFALTTGAVARQINVRDLDAFMATVTRVSLIAEPGNGDGRGEIVISQLAFDEGTAFGTVLEVKEPVYNVTAGWVENDEDTYDFTNNVDGSVTVDYTKGVDQGWLFMKNEFNLDLAQGYNTLTIVVSGTTGNSVLLKPNDSNVLQTKITFEDEEPVTVVFQGYFTKTIIFAEPGVAEVIGTFTIHSQKLSYVEPTVDYFDTVDFVEGWVAGVPNLDIYTITTTEGVTSIAWDRAVGQAWESVRYPFDSLLEQQNVITMTFQGVAGQQIIVKPNDNWAYERVVTFDGLEQTFTFHLNEPISFVLILVDPFTGSLTGSFDIIEAKTSYAFDGNLVETAWAENDPNTYDFTQQPDGSILVEYTKDIGQYWVFMRNTFDVATTEDMNLMLVILQGTVGKSILLKPNDSNALEHRVDFTNSDPVFVWVNADTFTNFIIFAEPNVEVVSGSFTILGIYLSYEQPEVLERDVVVDFETGWVDNGNAVYTFAEAGGVTTVTYDKGAAAWATMKYTFAQNLANHNLVTFTVQGTAGKQILIKMNNNSAYETWFTFNGSEQVIEIPLTYTLTDVLIFAEPEIASVTGTFDIISAQVSWVPVPLEVTTGWVVNDAGTYTLVENVDGSITVSYATIDYQFMKNIFDANAVLGLNTMTIVVQGTLGETILLKPNDSGTLEQLVTFDGTEQTIVIDATAFVSLFIFAAPAAATLTSGTFTIVSVTLTYVAPVEG